MRAIIADYIKSLKFCRKFNAITKKELTNQLYI